MIPANRVWPCSRSCNDALERRRAAVQLFERGDRVRLVEVEHVGVQQAAGVVELVLDPVGIGPQRLAGHEHLVAPGGQVGAHHRLGRSVLRGDVEVVDASAKCQVQPGARLLGRGGPAGGTAENGHVLA